MDDILQEALELRKQALNYNYESREDGIEDMEFELGGENAWDANVWEQRGDRPKVSLNWMTTRKHRLANDLRDLNPEIKVIPKTDEFDKQAEIRNTLIKEIQDKSCAESIFDFTFNQGLSAGFSSMRVVTDYETPESFEQCIRIKPNTNNLAVHWDYTYKNPSFIDMKWGLIEGEIEEKLFAEKYPDSSQLNFTSDAFRDNHNARRIITCEYYKIWEKPEKLVMLSNGKGGIIEGYKSSTEIQTALDYMVDGYPVWQVIQERDSHKPILQWYLLNGDDILEERKEMLGKYIPIIPYEGRSINIRGKKYLISFLRNLKEPARLKNYAKSLEVEMVALQPLAVWSAPFASVSDYMDFYNTANKKRWPVLPYNHKDKDGDPLPPPQMTTYNGPTNQLGGLFQSYDQDINDISGMYDDNLGAPSQLRAGVAIDLKQNQGNHNNYDFIDNFITRTLNYLGLVCNDLISEVYDDERTIYKEEEGKREAISLNQPGGIDMSEGEFEVKTVVGSANETKRREANELMVQLLEKVPAMQNAAHIIAKNMDNLQDKEELVKILKASLPPEILSLSEADEQAVALENSQLKQQIEQISTEYEQATELIKSMQIDYKKAMDVQEMKGKQDIQKEMIKRETTLENTELRNQGMLLANLARSFDDLTKKLEGTLTQQAVKQPEGDE